MALCDDETGADETHRRASRREEKVNELARYSFKFDAKGARGCESFEAFTRTFRIEEGAYTAPPAERRIRRNRGLTRPGTKRLRRL